MSSHEEPRSYIAARAQALQALLREMGSRELTIDEKEVAAQLVVSLGTLLGEEAAPGVGVQRHVELDS